MRYSGQCACRAAARPLSERRSGIAARRELREPSWPFDVADRPEVSARGVVRFGRPQIRHVSPARLSQPRRPRGFRRALAAPRVRAAALRRLGPMPRAIDAQASLAHVLVAAPGALSPETRRRSFASRRRRIDRPHSPGRAPRDAALLDFAGRLAVDPAAIDPGSIAALRAAGLGDVEILDGILATGLGRLLATLAAGLGSRERPVPPIASPAAPDRNGAPIAAPERSPVGLRAVRLLSKDASGSFPRLFRAQTLKSGARSRPRRRRSARDPARRAAPFPRPEGAHPARDRGHLLQRVRSGPSRPGPRAARSLRRTPAFRDGRPGPARAVRNLADRSIGFGDGDRARLGARGFSEAQIREAVAVTALAAFLNTVQAGLGVAPDFRPKKNLAAAASAANLSAPPDHPTGDERAPRAPVDDPDAPAVARARGGDMAAFEDAGEGPPGPCLPHAHRHDRQRRRRRGRQQAVFVKVFRKLDTFTGEARFSTWLTRIAINEGLERLRSRRQEDSLDERPEEDFRPSNLQPGWTIPRAASPARRCAGSWKRPSSAFPRLIGRPSSCATSTSSRVPRPRPRSTFPCRP